MESSLDIWKRSWPGSVNGTVTFLLLSNANSVRFSGAGFWPRASFACIAMPAVWIVSYPSLVKGVAFVTRVEAAGWRERRPTWWTGCFPG